LKLDQDDTDQFFSNNSNEEDFTPHIGGKGVKSEEEKFEN
jgi:hypothetical protein